MPNPRRHPVDVPDRRQAARTGGQSVSNPHVLVTQFHRAFGLPIGDQPTAEVTEALTDLRLRLLRDEVQELVDAVEAGDVVGMAQEMADVVYVVYGYAVTNGIPLDAVLVEVHRANMSKLDSDGHPVLREDGKVLKGPNYTPPDVVHVLAPPATGDIASLSDGGQVV